MTALHLVWLASAVGAVLFVAIGYMVASLRKAEPATAPALPVPSSQDDSAQLLELRGQLDAASQRASELQRQVAAEQQRAEQERSRAAKAEAERANAAAAGGQAAAVEQQLRTAQQATAEAERRAAEQAEQSRQQVVAAQQAAAAADKRAAAVATQPANRGGADLKAAQHAAARAEKRAADAEQKLADAMNKAGDLDEAEEATRVLTVEVAQLKSTISKKAAAPAPAAPAAAAQDPNELKRLRTELVRVQGQLAASRKEVTGLRKKSTDAPDAARVHQRTVQLERDLETERATAKTLKDELAASQRAAAAALNQDASAAKASTQQVEAAERKVRELAQRAEAAEARAARAEQLEEEKASLQEQLRQSQAASQDLVAVRDEGKDLSLRVQVAETKAQDAERLGEENAQLREKLKQSEAHSQELEAAREEAKALRQELQPAAGRAEELERLRDENGELRVKIADFERSGDTGAELDELRTVTKQLKLDIEAATRRNEAMGELATERDDLRTRVEDLARQAGDAEAMKDQVQTLKAQIYAAGLTEKKSEPVGGKGTAAVSLDRISSHLAGLVGSPGVRSAIVADNGGLLIAGLGDAQHHEELAALAGPAWDLATRAKDHLPLAHIRQVHIEDANQMVVAWRLFESGPDAFAVGVLSSKAPPVRDMLDGYVTKLSAELER